MVNKIYKTYIPAISMAFTVTILLAGILNWIREDTPNFFAFEVLGYLILDCVLDAWIGKFDFKSYLSHFLVESIVIYPFTLFFCIRFRWMGLNVINLLICSVIYLCVMSGIHIYFYTIEKNNVMEINQLLEEGRKRNG